MPREYEILNRIEPHPNCIYMKDFFFTRNNEGILYENFLF